jgi:hypothetical protein
LPLMASARRVPGAACLRRYWRIVLAASFNCCRPKPLGTSPLSTQASIRLNRFVIVFVAIGLRVEVTGYLAKAFIAGAFDKFLHEPVVVAPFEASIVRTRPACDCRTSPTNVARRHTARLSSACRSPMGWAETAGLNDHSTPSSARSSQLHQRSRLAAIRAAKKRSHLVLAESCRISGCASLSSGPASHVLAQNEGG